jgi:hypothetical protein
MKAVQRLFCLIFLITNLLFLSSTTIFSQGVNQVAYNVEIEDSKAESGSIVSYKDGKYVLSEAEYDEGLYGVISIDAQVTLDKITEKTKPVVTNGEVLVKVSKINGEIKRGDLITTSKDKGVGQKATRSGHILGKALKDFPEAGVENASGLIPVLINVNYNQISSQSEGLTDQGIDQVASKVSSSIISGNIPNLLKYIFALLLGTISFFVGLSHFVRSNTTAVEAIARNPLAKGDIQRQQFLGTVGILIVCGIGLAISVWILIFL